MSNPVINAEPAGARGGAVIARAVVPEPAPITRPPSAISAWPAVAADLRRTLLRAGRSERVVDAMLDELAHAFMAIERARGKVDDELVWALVAMQADRYRRRAWQVKQSRSQHE